MKKRRVTLNLDEDVVEALEVAAHRAALREWLDELDQKHGAPSREQRAAAKALLNAVEHGEVNGTSAA